MKVFIGYSFNTEADKELADHVQALVVAHGLKVTSGSRLDGEELNESIKEKIRGSDALVALLTRRELIGDRWLTHEWVKQELGYARAVERRAVAIVETGVELGGMEASHQWISFDPNQPLEAFTFLAEVIGAWKRAEGRTLVARLQPDDAGEAAAAPGATLRYRFFAKGEYQEWHDGQIVRKPGAILAYMPGADEESEVQVEIQSAAGSWRSVVEPQWLQLKLEQA
jgi:hypothetical protein